MMLRADTDRCFQLTATGTSALATVRLAGPGVISFLERRFSKRVAIGRPVHGELCDNHGVIDDPVVVLREDGFAADLTLHGGAWITRCVIDLAEHDGFALSPVDVEIIGSTDARTMLEHEVLASLPRARTELAARILLAQRAAWAGLDASCDRRQAILADRSLEHLLTAPTVAIVGLPNAGKSTLANCLFGQQRSIVSPVAGTTRDWVGEEANLNGLIVRLVDTPGRRDTTDPIERAAIAASDATIGGADLVVVLLDATRDDLAQRDLTAQFKSAMVVLNKIDERHAAWTSSRVDAIQAIELCATRGEGVASLVRRIHQHLRIDSDLDRPRAWTRRQRKVLAGPPERFHADAGL